MQDDSTDGRLVLDGQLTIRTAPTICTLLRETITQHSAVSLDCSAAEEVDMSFIQLLVAARATASGAGKTIALVPRPDGALLDALTRGGFHVSSGDPTDTAAFWFDGAAE